MCAPPRGTPFAGDGHGVFAAGAGGEQQVVGGREGPVAGLIIKQDVTECCMKNSTSRSHRSDSTTAKMASNDSQIALEGRRYP